MMTKESIKSYEVSFYFFVIFSYISFPDCGVSCLMKAVAPIDTMIYSEGSYSVTVKPVSICSVSMNLISCRSKLSVQERVVPALSRIIQYLPLFQN